MVNNTRFPNQPKFITNNNYVNDYYDLVNDYYSHWNLNTIKVTYYNLDIENSNIDKDKLNGGAYEMVGSKSGWRWRKILELPINGLGTVNTTPVNDEKGTTNSEKLLDAYFPRTTGVVPKVHDFVAFEQFNKNGHFILNRPPLYEVVNVEKSNDFEYGFYKINMKVSYVTQFDIDQQLHDILDFVDFEKRLYDLDGAIILQKIIEQKCENKLKTLFDQKSGLYCETTILED